MGPKRFFTLVLSIAVLSCASPASQGREAEDEARSDILFSDLPLYRGESENMWPQHFYDDSSFGCVSRVAFGDWVFREQGDDDPVWFRFRNYGAFHCWALVGRGYERQQLESAASKPAYFVLMGNLEVGGDRRELWAIQIGARPGSEYILLSRSPRDGLIASFDVLQIRCPRANVRDAGSVDILLTRYCAVNTRGDLLRLAQQMAHLPAVGSLALVSSDTDNSK
jgi:hypothetical protein